MAAHIRTQVRKAAVVDFTGLTTTGGKVFTGRIAAIGKDDMPCLNILLLDEDSAWDSAPNMARNGRLIVEGRLQAKPDELLDKLDQIAAEVEARAYDQSTTFNGLLQNIGTPTTQIDLPEPSEGNARPTGVIRILFPVTYRTAYTDPTTPV
ncbi:hypothetical protein [Devosia sp. Root635]|uniref:hypothetical protein n=1 Tax=Devosia sp. Root635 TaxID=1736575 RepID=UPI0006F97976|nr:hypothetical protein [Devosia sp. Root635]KRA44697.1 hypothetical protein ASD80_06025 [Devosia sp. Root635]